MSATQQQIQQWRLNEFRIQAGFTTHDGARYYYTEAATPDKPMCLYNRDGCLVGHELAWIPGVQHATFVPLERERPHTRHHPGFYAEIVSKSVRGWSRPHPLVLPKFG